MMTSCRLLIYTLVLVAASVALTSGVLALQWHIETVDSVGDVGWDSSIAIDVGGTVHVAYYDTTNGALRYATRSASGWQIETVDSVGSSLSLALDSSGRSHITYSDGNAGDLKYATQTSTGWQIQTVDSAGRVGFASSLALDSLDRPHVAYLDTTNHALKYARLDGSAWQMVTVATGRGTMGSHPSLALNSAGVPGIAYCDSAAEELEYASWTGTTWAIQSVGDEEVGDIGSEQSLAFDALDRAHISYPFGSLRYATYDGAAWASETVDPSPNTGRFSSLALDPAGNPHISYMQLVPDGTGYQEKLKYAHWNGSTWVTDYVDSNGRTGLFSSLALDSSGLPYITYYDLTNGDLKFAYATVPEPASLLALCGGLGALALRRKRR